MWQEYQRVVREQAEMKQELQELKRMMADWPVPAKPAVVVPAAGTRTRPGPADAGGTDRNGSGDR